MFIFFLFILGAQYIFRYRKYQLTEDIDGTESPIHTPRASLGTFPTGQLTSRASSTSTLLSEVAYLVKLRPKHVTTVKHSRLRESVESEAIESLNIAMQSVEKTKRCVYTLYTITSKKTSNFVNIQRG